MFEMIIPYILLVGAVILLCTVWFVLPQLARQKHEREMQALKHKHELDMIFIKHGRVPPGDNMTIQQQDEKGNWVDAEPTNLHLICEHGDCGEIVTNEEQYERIDKDLPNGWGETPEFLCKKHSIGRKRV